VASARTVLEHADGAVEHALQMTTDANEHNGADHLKSHLVTSPASLVRLCASGPLRTAICKRKRSGRGN
jgi:hypothetical protein